jgi:hypothetical protein
MIVPESKDTFEVSISKVLQKTDVHEQVGDWLQDSFWVIPATVFLPYEPIAKVMAGFQFM